jgi:hypothetical protein
MDEFNQRKRKWSRRLSLETFAFTSKEIAFKLKGKVQKLVIKNGIWEDRKWNDRFLEIRGSNIQYFFWQDEAIGKIIDNIEVLHITKLSAMSINISEAIDQLNSSISTAYAREVDPSKWQQITHNTEELYEVLQNCFLLRVESGNRMVRDYIFRTNTLDEAKIWVETIRQMIAHFSPPPPNIISKTRIILRPILDSIAAQVLFGVIISLNFIAFMYETQVKRRSSVPETAIVK